MRDGHGLPERPRVRNHGRQRLRDDLRGAGRAVPGQEPERRVGRGRALGQPGLSDPAQAAGRYPGTILRQEKDRRRNTRPIRTVDRR